MNRLVALLAALALALSVTASSHAGVSVKAPVAKQAVAPEIEWPEEPCNLEHRMDIAIVDGLFFECNCSRLFVGYQCDWMIIAGVTATRKIKSPKRITRITGGLLYVPRVRPVI